jgi:hypothetical protein
MKYASDQLIDVKRILEKPDTAAVSLVGGLGNQLFRWSFGQFLAERYSFKVVYVEVQKGASRTRTAARQSPLVSNRLSGEVVPGYRPAKLPRSVSNALRAVPILQEVEKKRRAPTFFSPDLGFVPL